MAERCAPVRIFFSFPQDQSAARSTVVALAIVVALVCGADVRAAPPSLDTITVSGTREDVSLGDTLQDVTVIDRATIEAHAGASLESLLAEQAGIQVSTSGGIGSVSSVFVRGTDSHSTLLLIDGMRYGSATSGTPTFYNLPLEQIDHIEIVRGPMSAVYGADAAGGVIQVFTRRGQPGMQLSGSATLGSEAYGALDAGVRGGGGQLDYAFEGGERRTDGYRYTNPHAGYYYNPNDDGFRQTSGSVNLGYGLAPGWSVRLQGLDSKGDVQSADGFDPSRPALTARSRVDTATGSLALQGAVAADWSSTLRYGASRDGYNTDVAVSGTYRFSTLQHSVDWQNNFTTPLGTVLAAVEQLRQSVSDDGVAFTVNKRTVTGVQLGLNGTAGPHSWQANVRDDGNSQFGHQVTGAAAYGYELTPQWRLGASSGTSFIAPSFDDLYYPGYSNPLLRPQHGQSNELSVRWTSATQQARLAFYENRFHDLIAYAASGVAFNVAQSRIRGASLEYDTHLGPVTLGSTLDVMDPRDLTDGTQLPRRARNNLVLKADWQFASAWSAGTLLRAAGQRYDDAANLQAIGGYGLLSAHCDWHMNRDWSLVLRVDNLTDHEVQPAYGYEAPPRQWFATVRYGGL
jgi:vitamin B12 transporter